MKRAFATVASIIVLIIAAFAAWWLSQTPTYTYRFRLVVEVEVDGALRSGASVIEVRTTDVKVGLPETKGVRSSVRGEAVFVDLGNGRNLIATLGFGPEGNDDKIDRLAYIAFWQRDRSLEIKDLPKLTGAAPLTGDLIPTLVTFADLNDSKTARVIRPVEFEQAFGSGVRFKRAWIEMTDSLVTKRIEKALPFLSTMREAQAGRSVLVHPDRLNIVPLLFSRN